MGFLGNFRATLDAKNRVAVPARLREKVEPSERDRFVIAPLPEPCLALYPLSVWGRIEGEVESRARTGLGWEEARSLERELFAAADEISVDKQGRVLISEDLKRRAGIEKEVMFLGVRNRIELWDLARWEARSKEQTQKFGQLAQEVMR